MVDPIGFGDDTDAVAHRTGDDQMAGSRTSFLGICHSRRRPELRRHLPQAVRDEHGLPGNALIADLPDFCTRQ
jgi:hypothetical protein